MLVILVSLLVIERLVAVVIRVVIVNQFSNIIQKPASTKNKQVVITLEVLLSFFVKQVVVVTLIVIERLVAGVKRVVVVTLAIKFLLFLLQMFLSMRC